MTERLRTLDEYLAADPDCPVCEGESLVCEEHPDRQWPEGDPDCGGPGMPCMCTPGGQEERG